MMQFWLYEILSVRYSSMVGLDMRLKSNVGAERVSHDWLFFVDANEVVGEDLATDLSRWKTLKQSKEAYADYRMGTTLMNG
jgi:hypothetical protein